MSTRLVASSICPPQSEIAMAQARRPATSETGDPLLLTPGPLTTSKAIKEAK